MYTLSFTKTYEGLLKVTVRSGASPHEAVAIYEDDKAFLHLVRYCEIPPNDAHLLERAVIIGFSRVGKPMDCEDLHLSDQQLQFLRLGMARRLSA